MCLLQMFSLSLWESPTLLLSWHCPYWVEVFNFNEVQLINFIPFVYYAYAAESKKIIAIAKMIKIFSYIIFKEFYSFVCIFRSVIHFELILKGARFMCRFILFFLHVNVQLFQQHLLKRLSLLHCIAFAPLSNINRQYACGSICWTSPGAQVVKNVPAMQETWVWSLGQEDPLGKGMATHSSIIAWKIPWTEEPGGLQSIGLHRVTHDWSSLARTHPHCWALYSVPLICFSILSAISCYLDYCSFILLSIFSSLWVMFSCFFTCLVTFYSIIDIVYKRAVETEVNVYEHRRDFRFIGR